MNQLYNLAKNIYQEENFKELSTEMKNVEIDRIYKNIERIHDGFKTILNFDFENYSIQDKNLLIKLKYNSPRDKFFGNINELKENKYFFLKFLNQVHLYQYKSKLDLLNYDNYVANYHFAFQEHLSKEDKSRVIPTLINCEINFNKHRLNIEEKFIKEIKEIQVIEYILSQLTIKFFSNENNFDFNFRKNLFHKLNSKLLMEKINFNIEKSNSTGILSDLILTILKNLEIELKKDKIEVYNLIHLEFKNDNSQKINIPDEYIVDKNTKYDHMSEVKLIEFIYFFDEKKIKYFKKNREQFRQNLNQTKELIDYLNKYRNRSGLSKNDLQSVRGVYLSLYETKTTFDKKLYTIAKNYIKDLKIMKLRSTDLILKRNISENKNYIYLNQIISENLYRETLKLKDSLEFNNFQKNLLELMTIIIENYNYEKSSNYVRKLYIELLRIMNSTF